MSIEQITQPLPGERVVALAPEDAQRAATDWLRRPNLFAGRALTDATLEQRQHWQAGRMAQRGQALTAGVVRGLEVATLRRAGQPTALLIEPGQGLAVNGEDVQLVRQLRCRWLDVPLVGSALTLGTAGSNLPRVGVLVLQPVVVDLANNDPSDPCERCGVEGQGGDASPVSFEDARRVDGARLLWLPWPADWALPATELRLRNALAHAIFAAEARLPHGAALPWEDVGVPIALIGLDGAREPVWVDRAAVVRRGGLAREAHLQRTADGQLMASSRLGPLWQARIEQFSEHLAELAEPDGPLPPLAKMADPFLHLPPCGLLPAGALDLDNRHAAQAVASPFFPPAFELDAVPVPLEQLDLAMREAASLAPIDLSAPERLRLLVPVPQASWESRLLQRELVAKEFQDTLDEFLVRRARELGARQAWRHRVALLEGARTGAVPPVPEATDDPSALEPESLVPWGPPPAEGGHLSGLRAGLHEIRVDGAVSGFAVAAAETLATWVCLDPENPPRALMLQWRDAGGWEHRAVWGEDLIGLGRPAGPAPHRVPGHFSMGPLPPAGRWVRLEVPAASIGLGGRALTGQAFTLHDGRAAFGPSGVRQGAGLRTWFAQQPPVGAQVTGDTPWQPLGSNDLWAPFDTLAVLQPVPVPVPFAGGGHLRAGQPGVHQHYLEGATTTLSDIRAGDELFVWVYLDAQDPPRELMLQFKAGADWTADGRRAYWGENLIGWGADNTPQRHRADATLPVRGQWVRVSVAATALDLVGRTVNGIAFTLFDGAAAFGPCGKLRPSTTGPQPSELPWFGASLPAGATPVGTWRWLAAEQMGEPTPSARVGQVGVMADLAADPSVRSLSVREQAQLGARGLQGFIDYLRARADRADDLTDFGFTHMQVDLHRVRQLMMSTMDASRLSASPALAAIAKSDSALNVQSQIREYVSRVKASAVPRAAAPAPAPAPAPRSMNAPLQIITSVVPMTVFKQQTQAKFIQPQAAPPKIVYAQPVVGQAELRTAAVADRLRQPPSTEARDYALANRHRAVGALLDLLAALRDEDGEVPAMLRDFAVPALSDEAFAAGPGPNPRTLEWFADPTQRAARMAMLLQPPPVMQLREGVRVVVDPTESDLFEQTVALSNATIGLLRRLEGRLMTYRNVIERAQRAMESLLSITVMAQQRQRASEENLAEARHDVSVARALLAEETARVQAVNDRRDRVLREEVPYLAFMRPRETGSVIAVPWRAIDPGLVASPVPACLRHHDEVPEELGELLQVLREAPVQHFASGAALLRLIERPQTLVRTVQMAQLRSVALLQRMEVPRQVLGSVSAQDASKLIRNIGGLLQKQQQQTLVARAQALQRVDLMTLTAHNWQQTQLAAQAVISLGDLVDGDHGSGEVARRAAALFNDMAAVCTCLHAEFSAVLPSIRLDWAELMSQFDETPNLRNLASLPGWAQIGGIDRRQMQALADHLFSQIDASQPVALALANDLVRMALLLASHAPVGRIVAGRLPRPVTGVRVGTRIPLAALDATRLRVGMQALVYQGSEIVARARVEDVGALEATATVVHARAGQVDLGLDVRVQFETASVVSASRARVLGTPG